MSNSIYTNTGLIENSWNPRGLISHNINNKNLIRLDNGVCFAAVVEDFVVDRIKILISRDNGFTWKMVAKFTWQTDPFKRYQERNDEPYFHGPVVYLIANEKARILNLYVGLHYYPVALANSTILTHKSYSWDDDYNITLVNTDSDIGPNLESRDLGGRSTNFVDVANNENVNIFTYLTYDRKIICNNHQVNSLAEGYGDITDEDSFIDILATYINDNNIVDILAVKDFADTYEVKYIKYDLINRSYNESILLSTHERNSIGELSIARDGYNNIIALWTANLSGNQFVDEYYCISTNDGISWSAPQKLVHSVDQTDYTDLGSFQDKSRLSCIPGETGWLLTYVRKLNEKSVGYVQLLHSQDGVEYILDPARIAVSHPTRSVYGTKFFLPVGSTKVNFNAIDKIRIAYQLGEADANAQYNSNPVYFGQKLLLDEAFPYDINAYRELDDPLTKQMVCSFNLLGTTYQNVDYYNEGLVGNITSKYLSAFQKFGTSVDIKQYEPDINSYLDDVSAYNLISQFYVKSFVQEINYSLPVPSGNETFTEYIERDARQIHLPPNLHLSRTFLINNGNKLKRTVWLLTYAGNEYELTQVVPKFIDNQIAYYTANAYVVGPSRNPFSRTILPSET